MKTSLDYAEERFSNGQMPEALGCVIAYLRAEQSSHAAKGEREGGDTKWWDGPRISAHEAAEDMKREAVVNAARHLHDAMVNGGGADTVKDAGEILGEALADYDEESDAACNCNPLEQTGGGHRGDCPAYEPECTCYEMTGGHQPMCPYGVALRAKAEQHGGGRAGPAISKMETDGAAPDADGGEELDDRLRDICMNIPMNCGQFAHGVRVRRALYDAGRQDSAEALGRAEAERDALRLLLEKEKGESARTRQLFGTALNRLRELGESSFDLDRPTEEAEARAREGR